MIKNNLVVYRIPALYEILSELELKLNYKVTYVAQEKELKNFNLYYCLIISNFNIPSISNQLILNFPLKISKLIEKININFLKFQTKKNSSIFIGNYEINLNSRILRLDTRSVNLTEKEINLIMFLNKSNNSVKASKIQSEVWNYGIDLETHTVETHIHRLRKKILKHLLKDNFIMSNKNGYYLNK